MEEEKKQIGNGNLIPLGDRATDEQRKIARLGGLKLGTIRRKQKEIKDLMNMIDNTALAADHVETYKQVLAIDNPTYRDAVIATIYLKALSGDMRAVELYLKLKGEMPKDIEINNKSLTVIWNENRYETDKETE